MKKLVIILSVVLASCANGLPQGKQIANINGVDVQSYTIDSCEYIGVININTGARFLTHKGNCKFCDKTKIK